MECKFCVTDIFSLILIYNTCSVKMSKTNWLSLVSVFFYLFFIAVSVTYGLVTYVSCMLLFLAVVSVLRSSGSLLQKFSSAFLHLNSNSSSGNQRA